MGADVAVHPVFGAGRVRRVSGRHCTNAHHDSFSGRARWTSILVFVPFEVVDGEWDESSATADRTAAARAKREGIVCPRVVPGHRDEMRRSKMVVCWPSRYVRPTAPVRLGIA